MIKLSQMNKTDAESDSKNGEMKENGMCSYKRCE